MIYMYVFFNITFYMYIFTNKMRYLQKKIGTALLNWTVNTEASNSNL